MLIYSILLLLVVLTVESRIEEILISSGIEILMRGHFQQMIRVSQQQPQLTTQRPNEEKTGQQDQQTDYIVMLYANSQDCPKCEDFVSAIFQKIGEIIDDDQVKAGAFNCDTGHQICEKLGVHEYPSIYYFKRDGSILYLAEKQQKSIRNLKLLIENGQRLQSNQFTNEIPEIKSNIDSYSLVHILRAVACLILVILCIFNRTLEQSTSITRVPQNNNSNYNPIQPQDPINDPERNRQDNSASASTIFHQSHCDSSSSHSSDSNYQEL